MYIYIYFDPLGTTFLERFISSFLIYIYSTPVNYKNVAYLRKSIKYTVIIVLTQKKNRKTNL